MVNFIKRDKNDIYGKPIVGFLFKNQKFLITLKIVVLAIFLYAIYFGFTHPGKDNIFTWAVFWGIFWSLFMVVTLPTFGRIFCGICPHGFMGKYITKYGLKKTMPKWMQNRYIGIFLLIIGWWAIFYTFPGVYGSALATSILFASITLLSFVVFFLYKDMSYCKYICPIGTLTRAFSKLSFVWLGTYKSACNDCKTFECATACSYNLKPFTFDKRNSMTDCTLCMDCSAACEAVSFKVEKPSFSLFSKFQTLKAEVWTFILIFASIPISMSFSHGLGHSNAADDMIWAKTAVFLQNYIDFGSADPVKLFTFLYAILFVVLAALIGMFIASKILKKDFSKIFYNLGYSYAPLFIIGTMAHTLEAFFVRGYDQIIKGFAQVFGFSVDVTSIASRGDGWLSIFGLLNYVAIFWALLILYKRMKLLDATKTRKIIAFPFAASLIIFFICVNIYKGYIIDTYGSASHSHGGKPNAHANHNSNVKLFQSVSVDNVTILQSGRTKNSCANCGMDLAKHYKANHASTYDEKTKQFCSMHCLTEDMEVKKNIANNIKVVDAKTLKFIDAKEAYYVLGAKQPGIMSKSSKFAFLSNDDAQAFMKVNGGKIVSFDEAYKNALEDFKAKEITPNRVAADTAIYFSEILPTTKRDKPYKRGHDHEGGWSKVPTKRVWPIFLDISGEISCIDEINAELFILDANLQTTKIEPAKNSECASIAFKMPDNGYYNLFFIDKTIENKTLYNKTSKFEYMRFNHSNDAVYDKEKMSPHSIKEASLDILRLREDDETFYHRLFCGETIRLKVLLDSNPIEDATLTLSTKTGWSKSIKTDRDGLATFTLVKDYFPEWSKFDKRHKSDFFLTATYTQDAKEQEYEKVKYISTYTSLYYPEPSSYESYAYGLIATTLTILLSGVAIYWFRARRQKPFKEISFDEKN